MKLHMQMLIALGLGLKRNGHIFFGLITGIIFGVVSYLYMGEHQVDNQMLTYILKILNVIGQAFIMLIQMIIVPLVFSAIVVGISSIGDSKQLGKFGIRMILYYGIITVA